jgi:glucose/arabinose dehydrogenase
MPDRDGDGVADEVAVFAEGGFLNRPHGLAFRSGWLYVANTDGLVRFAYERDRLEASEAEPLGIALPGAGQHWTRSLAFDRDGRMYVSVGSSCDVCAEGDARRAAILRLGAAGEEAAIHARGLRNAVGLAFHPVTGELWVTENGRDGLGDDLPPDEINRIVAGGNYGWPNCYGDGILDPILGAQAADCAGSIGPAVSLPAHSAPLGLAFYTGTMFPEEYWGDLFVAYHGSIHRSLPTGYKVVRVPFANGQPAGGAEDFVWGWLRRDTRRWGRPVDLIVAPDGALLVSDDAGGRVYRVYYARPKPTPTPWSR